MSFFGSAFFGRITPVVKNIIIINALVFLATFVAGYEFVCGYSDLKLNFYLGMYLPGSSNFQPYQIITHFFAHGGFIHLLFNMYALFLFGSALENVWGAKRFFIFYVVTALGAAFCHAVVQYVRLQGFEGMEYNYILECHHVVGASGAVFGLLLGFGMLFPNTVIVLLFPPIPIKAKYFVLFYGLGELYFGIANNPGDNVAHFAHLGGMLFGYLLIKLWKKDRTNFY